MSEIHFRDHGEFHGQVLRATLACAGLTAALRTIDIRSGWAPPAMLLLGMGGALLVWVLAPPKTGQRWVTAGLAIVAATGAGLLVGRRDHWLGLAVYGAVLGLYTAASLSRWRKVIAVLALAAGVPIAGMVAMALTNAGIESVIHPVFGSLLVGAAF